MIAVRKCYSIKMVVCVVHSSFFVGIFSVHKDKVPSLLSFKTIYVLVASFSKNVVLIN